MCFEWETCEHEAQASAKLRHLLALRAHTSAHRLQRRLDAFGIGEAVADRIVARRWKGARARPALGGLHVPAGGGTPQAPENCPSIRADVKRAAVRQAWHRRRDGLERGRE